MITAGQFRDEVRMWAGQVAVRPVEIHMRGMKRKVASCSSRGRLTFDPSLLGEPRGKRAEAILHELLHLKYPNHGRMFKRLLDAYLGTVENRREAGTL